MDRPIGAVAGIRPFHNPSGRVYLWVEWPGWRKRQTRRSQKPLGAIPCGFESHSRHLWRRNDFRRTEGGPEFRTGPETVPLTGKIGPPHHPRRGTEGWPAAENRDECRDGRVGAGRRRHSARKSGRMSSAPAQRSIAIYLPPEIRGVCGPRSHAGRPCRHPSRSPATPRAQARFTCASLQARFAPARGWKPRRSGHRGDLILVVPSWHGAAPVGR
jgi:hypothetical protein